MSYLGDFLFPPERARSPVKSLSGGERNRLLLARLFARPANVLVLDEPTNDLDIETLELLEELLQDYAGTVFLVSHDRALPRQRGHQHHRLGGRCAAGPVARIRRRLRGLEAIVSHSDGMTLHCTGVASITRTVVPTAATMRETSNPPAPSSAFQAASLRSPPPVTASMFMSSMSALSTTSSIC